MMEQFNDAKTNNMEAMALAKKGWDDCGGSSVHTTEQGVSELEDALKLINIKIQIVVKFLFGFIR